MHCACIALDVVKRSQYVQDLHDLCLLDQKAKKNTVCLLLESWPPGTNPLLIIEWKIECASNVVDVMEYSTLNYYIVQWRRMINEIMPRMSLKSTEVKNCSRFIRAILISPFWTSYCCQKQDFQRSSDQCCTCEEWFRRWNSILQNWIAPSSSRCTVRLSKKTDHFLRDIVRSESWFLWLTVNPFSFVHRYDSWRINKFPLLWFCICLWSGCNNLDTCLWRLILMWICRDFCIVVFWIDHVLVWSIRYSDPRLRIILTHRPDSNWNPMFAVLKTGCDF